MGLFGALFAGVSGLDSQSNKIGIISNNISNVNTVGFKQGQAEFSTLVVPSGTTTFSPGGVIGGNRQLINGQGTIAGTTSPTDVAITGGGLMFVSTSPAGGTGTLLYTRAGSFTQDANGNFKNANGYFLQGLPIDPKTGNPGPFSSLTTVNVSASATGKPTPTSTIALGANFNASQPALLGPGETITSLLGASNGSIPANQIIVGNDVLGANTNLTKRGDSFTINDPAITTPVQFTYNGFAIGRDVTVPFASGAGTTAEGAGGGLGDGNHNLTGVGTRTFAFTGNIMNAKSVTDDFLNGINTATNFTAQALNFSISVGNHTTKFTYNANPNPSTGTFNNMDTLVQAINDATGSGLTAQITGSRLYISALNPNQTVTFTNGDPTGSGGLAGLNWIQELDLPNLGLPAPPAGTIYFNSLQSLADAINSQPSTENLVATVTNPTGAASLSIHEANAQESITFTDGATNTGSMLDEFGFQGTTGVAPNKTVSLQQTYLATDPTRNMSSGAVAPQFTKDITIFDSLGQAHTIAINVAKIATGLWAVEYTSVPPGAVVSSDGSTGSTSTGQITSGFVKFDTNGAFQQSLSAGSLESFQINWVPSVGASQSQVTVDLGQNNASASSGIGLTQAAGAFNVSTVQQNGSPTGELTGVSIDTNGFVIASFSNGQTQKMFQLPLANFTNPDGLESVSGDAFSETLASGPVNPQFAGTSGVGTFTPSALEQSNVDLSTQLTDLIVAQQAYGANSKVLTVTAQLLQELDQIIQ